MCRKQRGTWRLREKNLATLQILMMSLQVLFVSPLLAHGDIHHQIETLNQAIKSNGPSASSLIQRANLHRLHKDWSAALEDLSLAEGLGVHDIELHKARVYIDEQKSFVARLLLNKYIQKYPNDPDGYFFRSQTWLYEKDYLKAVEDLDQTLTLLESNSTDLYFQRATLLKKLGGEKNLKRALSGLDDGLSKIGPLINLQELAIQIDLDLKDFDDALRRIDKLLSVSQRKETWLALKADILSRMGNYKEARIVKKEALQAIANLPLEHRNTRAIVNLEDDLKNKSNSR